MTAGSAGLCPQPVVTGFGVFTAFGQGADAVREGVFAGRPAFGPVDRFDTSPYRGDVAATAPAGAAGPWRQFPVLLRCAEQALEMAGIDGPCPAPVLVGTQGDHTEIAAYWSGEHDRATPQAGRPGLAAELPHRLGEQLGLGTPRLAFQNACIASSDAVVGGCRMIAAGLADTVVCGGAYLVDAEFFGLFDSGRAFSRDGRLRPFDRARSGLLLGDGAAVLVLESRRAASARGARVLAGIAGWGLAADAHHVVRPHPDGAGLATAITAALRRADIRPADLDYVNAHGTGTPANDPAETRALHTAFGADVQRIPVSSTKGATGHMLEATGVVELVIGLLALTDGRLPPTTGLSERDPLCDLDLVTGAPRHTSPHRILSINAGFGGINSAIVLEAA